MSRISIIFIVLICASSINYKDNENVTGASMQACSCLVQTQYGWESHVLTDKHQRVKQSLKQCDIEGEFDEPLGRTSPGISSVSFVEIDILII